MVIPSNTNINDGIVAGTSGNSYSLSGLLRHFGVTRRNRLHDETS